jgi:P pilus assembly chaperone PapD
VLSPDSDQKKKLEDCRSHKKKISPLQAHEETIQIASATDASLFMQLTKISQLPRQNPLQISITTSVSKLHLNPILSLFNKKNPTVFFHCVKQVVLQQHDQLCTPINIGMIYSSSENYIIRR